jgi:hypothetical protein
MILAQPDEFAISDFDDESVWKSIDAFAAVQWTFGKKSGPADCRAPGAKRTMV